MSTHRVTIGLACCLLVLGVGCDSFRLRRNNDKPDKTTRDDQSPRVHLTGYTDRASIEEQVLNDLHRINHVEMNAGKLAIEKAASEDVRQFGEHLWRDHRRSDEQLRQIATSRGFDLRAPRPTPGEQQMIDRLQRASGEEFDRVFAVEMQDAHANAILRFESAQANLDDSQVRDFIAKTLATLQNHEQLARDLQDGGSRALRVRHPAE